MKSPTRKSESGTDSAQTHPTEETQYTEYTDSSKDTFISIRSASISNSKESEITRMDGRDNNEERHMLLEISNNNDVLLRKYIEVERKPAQEVRQKLFSSAVVLYTTVEIRKPSADNPRKGLFTIYSNDRHIQSEAENIFNRSKILPLDKLSLIPKKAIISIRIDVIVVHDKGGILELITEGIYQILCRIVINQQIHTKCTPLELSKEIKDIVTLHPRTTTCAVNSNSIIYDPTDDEVADSEGSMVLTRSTQGPLSRHQVPNSQGEIVYWMFTGSIRYSILYTTIERIIATN